MRRTERGWAGHYILADRCKFRRNTLLEAWGIGVVVSTIGLEVDPSSDRIVPVGVGRYFETQSFRADLDDRWKDADVSRPIHGLSAALDERDADDRANDMHERVVREAARRLRWRGWLVRLAELLALPEEGV